MCLKISFLVGYIVNFPKCEPEWSFFSKADGWWKVSVCYDSPLLDFTLPKRHKWLACVEAFFDLLSIFKQASTTRTNTQFVKGQNRVAVSVSGVWKFRKWLDGRFAFPPSQTSSYKSASIVLTDTTPLSLFMMTDCGSVIAPSMGLNMW